ncbi:hypothetical protein WJ47_17245 [Burkholderia ubonensis]|uniref:Uncharacterized protein n=1 Tax=Burkholderia ubonensis TaxID=101571 RepID=A0AB73FYQ1_9BURK|nr:hypothetical protein WJ44_15350 [Burkholderia ubonensis]KVL61850.1 hypothetical protein WJ47_17245 [Burkholderia ubonensis]KVM28629.1 hypothetical protein WJ53_09235 [Burkholderia ubonensis]KVM35140.1 hypothetical protein WJ54_36235 [Burkholderia ubonensis]
MTELNEPLRIALSVISAKKRSIFLMLPAGSLPGFSAVLSTEARNAAISALCAASVPFEYERGAVPREWPIRLAAMTGP